MGGERLGSHEAQNEQGRSRYMTPADQFPAERPHASSDSHSLRPSHLIHDRGTKANVHLSLLT